MKGFFAFIKSKQFFIHFGSALLLLVLIFFILIKWLSSYTNHNQFVEVPDFKGVEVVKLNDFINGKEVAYEIIDSIYDPKQKPGVVLRQDPEPACKVKHNRTVYLYVTGMVAPQIVMPKLVDRSERQARLIISSYGLKMGRITQKSADCNGCVIAQLCDGKEIAFGEPIKKGSKIDLVVGVKDSEYNPTASDTTKTEDVNFDDPNEK